MEDTYSKAAMVNMGAVKQSEYHYQDVPMPRVVVKKRIFKLGTRIRLVSCSLSEYMRPYPLGG